MPNVKHSNAWTKIFRYHLSGGDFDLSQFLNMDVKSLPLILGSIATHFNIGTDDEARKCTALYRVLKNVPELCGFPSTERIARRQLEAENAQLKVDVADLQRRNEELVSKIEELESNKRPRKD